MSLGEVLCTFFVNSPCWFFVWFCLVVTAVSQTNNSPTTTPPNNDSSSGQSSSSLPIDLWIIIVMVCLVVTVFLIMPIGCLIYLKHFQTSQLEARELNSVVKSRSKSKPKPSRNIRGQSQSIKHSEGNPSPVKTKIIEKLEIHIPQEQKKAIKKSNPSLHENENINNDIIPVYKNGEKSPLRENLRNTVLSIETVESEDSDEKQHISQNTDTLCYDLDEIKRRSSHVSPNKESKRLSDYDLNYNMPSPHFSDSNGRKRSKRVKEVKMKDIIEQNYGYHSKYGNRSKKSVSKLLEAHRMQSSTRIPNPKRLYSDDSTLKNIVINDKNNGTLSNLSVTRFGSNSYEAKENNDISLIFRQTSESQFVKGNNNNQNDNNDNDSSESDHMFGLQDDENQENTKTHRNISQTNKQTITSKKISDGEL